MQTPPSSFAILSDQDLLNLAKQLAAREREGTVTLIASLMEIDARRLYLGEGCSSLFAYCTRVLRLSEHAAYHRIEAARAARRFPVIFDLLADGSMTLTNITLLAPHLTTDNVEAVLDAARHRSKRDVERQVAALAPRPDVPSSIRREPVRATRSPPVMSAPDARVVAPSGPAGSAPPAPATRLTGDVRTTPAIPPATAPISRSAGQRPVVAPLSPERYKVQITVSGAAVERLRRVQDLMRHTVPDGDPAAIFERALTLLLAHLERTRLAATDRPRTSRPRRTRSRHILAAVRRQVWVRDQGQCTFVGREGVRCGERGFLQFHHREPYALGGEATLEGTTLRCAAHNRYEAEQEFGTLPSVVREERRSYGASAQRLADEALRAGPAHSARAECSCSRYAAPSRLPSPRGSRACTDAAGA